MEFSGLTDVELPSVLQSVQLRRQNPHCQADLTTDMYESKTFLMSAPWEKICCVCSYWFIDSLSWATVASEWDRLVTKACMRDGTSANGLALSANGCITLWCQTSQQNGSIFALYHLQVLLVSTCQQKQITAAESAQMQGRKSCQTFQS